MKNIIFILVFVFAAIVNFAQNKHEILWTEGKPLTWSDFKGKPEPRFAAASTVYDIIKYIASNEGGTAHIFVNAIFFKDKSWKKKRWINDGVLAHEQKHFDVVELFARKLRKAIKEMKPVKREELGSKIQELYDINDVAMDKYQDQYDDETDGSMNGDKQREWQKKIMKEIAELDAYKSNEVVIAVGN
jgi:hypothetical protein